MNLRNGRRAMIGLAVIGSISGLAVAGIIVNTQEQTSSNICVASLAPVGVGSAYGMADVTQSVQGPVLATVNKQWGNASDFLPLDSAEAAIEKIEALLPTFLTAPPQPAPVAAPEQPEKMPEAEPAPVAQDTTAADQAAQ